VADLSIPVNVLIPRFQYMFSFHVYVLIPRSILLSAPRPYRFQTPAWPALGLFYSLGSITVNGATCVSLFMCSERPHSTLPYITLLYSTCVLPSSCCGLPLQHRHLAPLPYHASLYVSVKGFHHRIISSSYLPFQIFQYGSPQRNFPTLFPPSRKYAFHLLFSLPYESSYLPHPLLPSNYPTFISQLRLISDIYTSASVYFQTYRPLFISQLLLNSDIYILRHIFSTSASLSSGYVLNFLFPLSRLLNSC